MNALLHARVAYADPNDASRTPRDIEYRAFARATRALTENANASGTSFARLADALTMNRRLWATLARDLADDGNGLPQGLRASLLSLAQFVMTHTEQVLSGTETVQPLIDVNTAIMRGLRGQHEAAP
ncbi:flagellar biosynthesis regulator FlaF [Rhodobacteraceae bacterium 2376]|uniref:Flagellar biosynthesis regulator FlaF n=1 Tax=Rhabdonatronobacter sediminivivens TaxID=2743469 RepID=A0A7Z0HZ70_9RHOB|nr:flagellar biosynthesis regulator FlaF [Rhabdonatronobacter sediminivivens]NYS25003.1 flagellar biosynthesis regulator FlaF [Rhabdonatronobacter sediminivivens]